LGFYLSKHWTEKLFIDAPDLFRTLIEARFEKTEFEIEGLLRLFEMHDVPEGGKLLDMGCGIGRISIPLAKKGYNVVGLDLSPSYIQRAIEYAKEEEVKDLTRFIVGDMRDIESVLADYTGFDVVLSMWTSMGYWDEGTDRSILGQCFGLVKPGGYFIMHTASRDGLIKRFQSRDFVFDESGMLLMMERNLDLETSRMENQWSYYQRDGEDLRFLNRVEINHRVYSLHELRKQFIEAGWEYVDAYAGFELKPFNKDVFSLVIVSKK